MNILSIDIGVINLGLSLSSLNENYSVREILSVCKINITEFACDRKTCVLYHDKTFTDYMEHVFIRHQDMFDLSTHILIERQPPMGFVVVEQLIFSKFRSKSILINPCSMHKYFSWKDLTYEERKVKSIVEAEKYINLDEFERKHDIADSICIMIFWASKKQVEFEALVKIKKTNEEIRYAKDNNLFHIDLFIDSFRFIQS